MWRGSRLLMPGALPPIPSHGRLGGLLKLSVTRNIHDQIKPKLIQATPIVKCKQKPLIDIRSFLQRGMNIDQLKQVHANMIITALIHYPPAASKLVTSFASSSLPSRTRNAHLIAKKVEGLDTYTWNAIIRGYLEERDPKNAILVYHYVKRIGLKVDSYTLLFVVKACGLVPEIYEGEQVHGQTYRLGFVSELIIQTALLSMYGLFDRVRCIQQVFDETPLRDIVMWNSLLAAYVQQDYPSQALAVSHEMVKDNMKLNGMTVVSILSACSALRDLRVGTMIHGYVIRNSLDKDVFVLNALIGMYLKCKSLSKARVIFRTMGVRNVVSWTSMINGFSDNNYLSEALALFREMESRNIKPDEITILGMVSTCSKLGSFELGEWIDKYVERKGFGKTCIPMANALMDMHAKCGNINKACQIFDEMVEKTMVSWTTIIHGLALHGHGTPALIRFCQMQREGFKPDGVVFLNILSACSHAGLVDEGKKCFDSMMNDYGIKPWMDHYGCMVDLLCRAQLINEAFEYIIHMPFKPDVIIWRILLRACQSQGDAGLASRVMGHFAEHDQPRGCEDYILLSNLYAAVAEWDGVDEIRKEMKGAGVIKQSPGYSSIQP